MKILRRGATKDHGLKSVEIKKVKHRWNPTIKAWDSSSMASAIDFSTDARHNYIVRRSLAELAAEIDAFGDDCKNIDSDEFADAFAPILPALIKIVARASQAI